MGCRVYGLWFMVYGLWFRVHLVHQVPHVRQVLAHGEPLHLVIDSGLVWEGFRESRTCSRDTYPESYITEYILIYEDNQ